MRFKAILAEAARKRYPLSIMIMVVGVLFIPFPYLFIHYALSQTGAWWSALGAVIGVVIGSAVIGLGSLVEDIHDISMHTAGYDVELNEQSEMTVELDETVDDIPPEAEAEVEEAPEQE